MPKCSSNDPRLTPRWLGFDKLLLKKNFFFQKCVAISAELDIRLFVRLSLDYEPPLRIYGCVLKLFQLHNYTKTIEYIYAHAQQRHRTYSL